MRGDNQTERIERLDGELKNLSDIVKNSVRVKEMEPCFRRIDEIGLRRGSK